MEYRASLDTVGKVITALVVVIFLVIGYRSASIITTGESGEIWRHSFVLLFLISTILGCWGFAPVSYILDNHTLKIKRRVGDVLINLADIQDAHLLDTNSVGSMIRTFGVGGLFGYFGKYYLSGIGSATVYATQKKNLTLIVTNRNKRIVISPDSSDLADKLINSKS